MNKIGIIGAMSVEIKMLLERMENKAEVTLHDLCFYTGKLGGKEVVLTNCSIGKVNAAMITQMMIDKFGVDALINTGIAGSMGAEVKHLDIVVSKEAVYHDVRKVQMVEWYPNQPSFKADPAMVEAAVKAAGTAHVGTILTGDDFIDSHEKKAKIAENHQGLCLEMEGAAIAHVCFVNKVPFVIIRCISDMADGSATTDFDEFGMIAADKSADITEKMMALL